MTLFASARVQYLVRRIAVLISAYLVALILAYAAKKMHNHRIWCGVHYVHLEKAGLADTDLAR